MIFFFPWGKTGFVYMMAMGEKKINEKIPLSHDFYIMKSSQSCGLCERQRRHLVACLCVCVCVLAFRLEKRTKRIQFPTST